MTNTDKGRLGELEAVLDAYGADRTRWPAPVRHTLSSFISGSAEAQRLVREAEAFDRLLDAAPTLADERVGELARRIADSAARQPRVVHEGVAAPKRAPIFGLREQGWAAAALAASLALGVFAGQLPAINSASTFLIEAADSGDDANSQQTATLDIDDLSDEELL